ncbi:MAG: hypothetical protein HQL76_01045 [Magnetococcales bacterium]|nr:hypothetical protein [Magnetococcales bacterium]
MAARRHFVRHLSEKEGVILGLVYARRWLEREVHSLYRPWVARFIDTAGLSPPVSSWLLEAAPWDEDATLIRWFLERRNRLPIGDIAISGMDEPGELERFVAELADRWRRLGGFARDRQQEVRRVGAREKEILNAVGGADDRERIALVDGLIHLDRPVPCWDKMGFVPRFSCPESCRHCMFIWRPPMKTVHESAPLLAAINRRGRNLLFTGGDLTPDLELFHQAIATMDRVETFAILLNARLAHSREAARQFFAGLYRALDRRPSSFAPARVQVQISFDEYHQEMIADRHGALKERIPVAHVARLLLAQGERADCSVSLIHKQNILNFSTRLFQKGVWGRLNDELERRGWAVTDIQWQTSPRLKEYPGHPGKQGGVIREAQVTLMGTSGKMTFYFFSSCIDAMGRARLMERGEYVHEGRLLEGWLDGKEVVVEPFDTDPMIWRDGTVTVFGAIHLWMGNVFEDGDQVWRRWHADPLRAALQRMDHRLLAAHRAWNGERYDECVRSATSPHALMHAITSDARARLFLTRWLLDH